MCATSVRFPVWSLEPANLAAGNPDCPKCHGSGVLIATHYHGAGAMDAAVSCFVCGGMRLSVLAQRPDRAAANGITVASLASYLA